MLTRMSSIALAHASHPAPFNVNFYVVAATVIPVLILAIGIMGNQQAVLLRDVVLRRTAPLPHRLGCAIYVGATYVGLLFGMIAEAGAIFDLWNQTPKLAHFVLWALLILVFVTGGGTAFQWIMPVITTIAKSLNSDNQSASGEADPEKMPEPR